MNYRIYEFTENKDEAEIAVGDALLRAADISEEEKAEIVSEAEKWKLTEHVSFEETLYWHNDDERSGSFVNIHSFSELVIKDGKFYGVVLRFTDENGFGMSYGREEQLGVLCIDGAAFGTVTHRVSRSSSETDRNETGTFTLTKK